MVEGQTVSHYRILGKIGEGGMGEVYLAEDTSLERKVALKFLPVYLQQDETAHKRFIREAKSAAAIDHPYICHINEVGQTDDGQDYIVMEYVEGHTLQAKLSRGKVPAREALKLASEISEALERAHQEGIVHRDLKPANIMLTPDGHVKVMDFGLAKKIVDEGGTEHDITAALTREGTTLGTLAYMVRGLSSFWAPVSRAKPRYH
jgi:serine/threonine protein kinase